MSFVVFKINGKEHQVDGRFGPDVSLNEYIRNVADLRGTKAMCQEGGCGACVVAVRAATPPTNEMKTFAVNSVSAGYKLSETSTSETWLILVTARAATPPSHKMNTFTGNFCLVSVLSCHGWEVTTVEGIGNRTLGYHDVQSRLAKFNGTQCGYCSPGWVMSMYSLIESKNKNLTMKNIENSFASNICRCTGYRPISDAFKSFAKDADQKLLKKVCDLEDLAILKPCGVKCNKQCPHKKKNIHTINKEIEKQEDWCELTKTDKKILTINSKNHKWSKVFTLDDVFKTMMEDSDYKLIAGNTGQGVYHVSEYPTNIIDIFNVIELKGYMIDMNLIIGAGMPLTDLMDLCLALSNENGDFSYLKQIYEHLDLVAHIPVKNIGTIGGNLCLKHANNQFQSDLFLLFETVGGMVTVAESIYNKYVISLPDFLKIDMKNKVLLNVILPPLSRCCNVKTFKIMPRSQNAHAIVNAGFLFRFPQNSQLLANISIVYGGISRTFIHATKTEAALVGKDPFTNETLQLAVKSLYDEVIPEEMPPEPSAGFRRMLAVALYYKAILSMCPEEKMDSKFKSGGETIKRIISEGNQIFDTDKSVWPLNQPVPKLEALVQCSGEATFANDLPTQQNEVFGAFVTADVVPGSIIDGFDATEALKISGVVAFYSAKDIPGDNSFIPPNIPILTAVEEILCSGKVKFYGQPAGIIVADRAKTAEKAAKVVIVNYSYINNEKPLLTIDDVLKSPEKNKRVVVNKTIEPTDTGYDVRSIIQGEFKMEGQYHYHMETQTAVVKPTEDGMEVYSATQWLDLTNVAVAQCLKVPANSINVIVRRVGGAYGAKISRAAQVACAAALVSHLQGTTCRFVLPLQTNMKSIGKRLPTTCNFEAGVDTEGAIQYLKLVFYQDCGHVFNEVIAPLTAEHIKNCYDTARWAVEANSVATDTASNTYCRAPGTTEGIAMIEHVMERIAFNLKKILLK